MTTRAHRSGRSSPDDPAHRLGSPQANLQRAGNVCSDVTWPRAAKLPDNRHRILAVVLAVLPVLAAAACTPSRPAARPPPTASPPTASTQPQPQVPASLASVLADTVVLYGIGVSTDPYAYDAVAAGIGVATATTSRQLATAEVHGSGWGGNARWLRPGQVLVERPARAGRPAGWLLYRYAQGRLGLAGRFPLPSPVGNWAISPDGSLVAFQPVRRAKNLGLVSTDRILVQRADGSARRQVAAGTLAGWTPAGRLLYWPGPTPANAGTLLALDLATGTRTPLVSGARVAALAGRRRASLLRPVFSADRRYLAARAFIAGVGGALLLARADGTPIRLLTSPYDISMFAWSAAGHRLAYTTSGAPVPHQLLLIDQPTARPRLAFEQGSHFDWVTWSPDGRWLLVDNEAFGAWTVLSATTAKQIELPRLGGRPLWCCPQNGLED
jgi:dipeptidyl aminopeptidase/acylaminoacyl peptidase